MDLRQMLYTITVAQLGTMTKAAENLHVSQSTLSLSIKHLEEELGVSLFEKEGRNIVLTDIGTEFCKKAADILLLTDELKADMFQMRDNEKYTIRICTDAIDFSNEAITYYSRKDSRYRIEQLRMTTEESRRMLRSHHAPLALTMLDLTDTHITSELILEEPMFALLSAEYPLDNASSVSLTQFSGLPVITQKYGHALNTLIHEFFEKSQTRSGRIIEVNDPETIIMQVPKVRGISFIPESAYLSQQEFFPNVSRDVRAVPVKEAFCRRCVYLSYPNDRKNSSTISEFAEFLREMGRYVSENRCYPTYAEKIPML